MRSTFTEDKEAVIDAVRERIGPQKFRVWFKNSTRFTLTEKFLNIGVPNQFIASWLENHFINDINEAVRNVTGSLRKVNFGIDPSLTGRQKKSQLDSQAENVERTQAVSKRSRLAAKKTHTQTNPRLTLDTFVTGSSNDLAYNAARTVASHNASPFNPLFIHGGYGLGKTHLLHGMVNEITGNRPDANCLYVSAEQFANEFVLALKTKKLEAFRKRFRKLELLAIDDIHFLANKSSMQEEFLHTFNSIDLAGKQVVLASDAHPKMIGRLCDQLVNRFVSGMVVKIDTPDMETRCRICQRWARSMGKEIPDSVIQYIAEKMRTNVRELEGALLKITAYASMSNEPINLESAMEVLAEHISRTDPIVHISDIASAVTTFFGVTTADIYSSRKDRTVSLARSFTMFLIRKYTKMSYPEIGRNIGGKNHATVILACKKIDDLVERNAEIRWSGPSGNRVAPAAKTLNQLIESIS